MTLVEYVENEYVENKSLRKTLGELEEFARRFSKGVDQQEFNYERSFSFGNRRRGHILKITYVNGETKLHYEVHKFLDGYEFDVDLTFKETGFSGISVQLVEGNPRKIARSVTSINLPRTQDLETSLVRIIVAKELPQGITEARKIIKKQLSI
jgi:hypothetical protein